MAGRALPVLALCALLAGPVLPGAAGAREPSEYEQYMVELVNRARLDPAGEAVRLGTGTLNEGPPSLGPHPYTIPSGPKQPVAISLEITDAAGEYAERMEANDTFCHTCLGDDELERMWVAGYVPQLSDFDFFDLAGYTLLYGGAQEPGCQSGCVTYVPGRENLGYRGESPANGFIDDLAAAVAEAHAGLFNDFMVSSRAHRSTLLYGEWREVGIGMAEGLEGSNTDSVYIVQDFAQRADRGPFLTGVAFDDVDEDGFYTPGAGEALPGVTIVAYAAGTAQVVGSAVTMQAGGYRMELPVGVYDVVATGPGVHEVYEGVGILASGPNGLGENTKLDVVPVPEPGPVQGLAAGIVVLAALRRRARLRVRARCG
jgi:serralysin